MKSLKSKVEKILKILHDIHEDDYNELDSVKYGVNTYSLGLYYGITDDISKPALFYLSSNGYVEMNKHPKTGLNSGYLLNDKGLNYYLNGEYKSDLASIKRIYYRINAETIIKIITFIMALFAFLSSIGLVDIKVS
jgi:hypothetical protein